MPVLKKSDAVEAVARWLHEAYRERREFEPGKFEYADLRSSTKDNYRFIAKKLLTNPPPELRPPAPAKTLTARRL